MNKFHDNYEAWNWDYKKIPQNSNFREKLIHFINGGILAANLHNTQPWKFELHNKSILLSPNLQYYLPKTDPEGRNLFISLGCCIGNIICVAAYYGFNAGISIKGNKVNDACIEITFKEGSNKKSKFALLAPFITKRYSNKQFYDQTKIDEKYQKEMLAMANIHTNIVFTEDSSDKDLLAEMHSNAMKHLASNAAFRRDLAHWLRPNNTKEGDGMPGFVAGLKPLQAIIGRKLVALFPASFYLLAKKDKLLLEKSPLVGLISTRDNSLASWINTGITYELLCLKTISLGINITPMHSIVEDKEGIACIKKVFHIKNAYPQMFFRLGYATNKLYHTPRRLV